LSLATFSSLTNTLAWYKNLQITDKKVRVRLLLSYKKMLGTKHGSLSCHNVSDID